MRAAVGPIGSYLAADAAVQTEHALVAQGFDTHDATPLTWKDASLPQLAREIKRVYRAVMAPKRASARPR